MTSLPIDVIATTEEDDEEELSLLPLPWIAVAIVCVGVAITTAVGGNMLILLSYCRDRHLRNVHNLYLVHLAVCDCLLGAISMPLYLLYTVMDFTWPLGKVMCNVFMVEDFALCTMSTTVVILVAYDRLALVKFGVDYETTETRCRAYFRLTVCWLFSFLLYSPAILLWETISGRSVVPPDDCDVEFYDHFVFVLVTEVIAFAVPFFSLTVLSVLLFLALRKRRNKVGIALKESEQRRQSRKPVQQGTMQLPHSPEQVRKSQNQIPQRPMQLRQDCLETEHSLVQSKQDPKTLGQSPERLRERPEHVQNKHTQKVWYSLEKTEYKQDHTQQNHDTMCISPDPTRQIVETVRLNAHRLSSPENSHLHVSPLRVANSCPVTNESDEQTETRSDVGNEKLQSSEIQRVVSKENGRVWMSTSTETLDRSQSQSEGQDGPSGIDNSDVTASTASMSVPYSTASLFVPYSTASHSVPYSTASTKKRRSQHVNKRSLAAQRERRVALILACLVLALVVCWLPYSICTIAMAACEECVNEDLNEFVNWLLWFKSCVNPFLYAYMSPRFRKNFLKLLGPLCPQSCRKRRKRRHGRVNTSCFMTMSTRYGCHL